MAKCAAVLVFFVMVPVAAQGAVNISTGATKHMSCSAGVCMPTGKNAVLNAGDLAAMLAASDVTVRTGAGAVTIEITAPFAWSSAHTLTLDANLNVSVKAQVVVESLGGLAVLANDGGTGGDLKFFPGGKIDFWDTGASFTLNGKSHVLVNDIAAMAAAYAANRYAALALAKDYDAGPDGTYPSSAVPTPMDGTFEGLGHTISNFSAAGDDRLVGLFSQSLSEFSVMRDLSLDNANVAGGSSSLAGTLAGATYGAVIGVHATGKASGKTQSSIGGLVGYSGVFTRADSSVTVNCGTECYAGGLVGFGGSFFLSHAGGTVTAGPRSAAGGLTGFLGSTMDQSYATGDIVASNLDKPNAFGGLVGSANQYSSITDSYALGAVHTTAEGSFGGLLGAGSANIVKNAYAVGAVGGTTPGHKYVLAIGGFVGFVSYPDEYSSLYWDIDTSGQTVGCGASKPRKGCPKITGLSDAALKSGLPAGFDRTVWGQSASINKGYPYLLNNPPQ